jgi:hypothetical protein
MIGTEMVWGRFLGSLSVHGHHESAGGIDGVIDEAEMVDRPHSAALYCRSVFGGDGSDRNRAEGVWRRCDVWVCWSGSWVGDSLTERLRQR